MKIIYAESTFWENKDDFKQRYEGKIERAYQQAKKHLPEIPKNVTFVVQARAFDAIPETGEGGWAKNSELIILSLDPGLPYGEEAILKQVRATVFHELNHAARYESDVWHQSFLDSAIMEGLATVFERERADSQPLWGVYDEAEVKVWLSEINGEDVAFYEYMYRHPDGRRWIGYKTGTYIVDQAIKNSKKTIEQLTRLECKEIMKLSGLNDE